MSNEDKGKCNHANGKSWIEFTTAFGRKIRWCGSCMKREYISEEEEKIIFEESL